MWPKIWVSRSSGSRLIWEGCFLRCDPRGKGEAVERVRREVHVYLAREISQGHTLEDKQGSL